METKVAVRDLKIGMFVADLDRPWIDTPFLLQGFLIEDEQQLRQLQRHCHFVIIDRARSTGDEYEAPAVAKPEAKRTGEPRVIVTTKQAESPARPVPSRPGAPIPPPGRRASPSPDIAGGESESARRSPLRAGPGAPVGAVPEPPRDSGVHGSLLGGMIGRIRGLWQRPANPLPAVPVELPPEQARVSILPPTVQMTIYEDARTVEEEIAPARATFTRTSEVLEKLAADVWDGQPVEIERVDEVVDEMVESMVRNPDALMWVSRLRAHDITTYGHGLQVAVYLVAFGRHLGFPRAELAQLGSIGLLLDIGKIRLPREILLKQGPLTSGEFETVKAHVAHSLDILDETPNWHPDILDGIGQHHERMNGSGYPRGLKEDEISFFGRMAGITDCFAALTKPRPYAPAVSSYEALRSISGWSPDFFHEPLVEQFVQAIGVFPVGSMVELSTGEVAVVVSHNKLRRLKPRVLLLTAPDKTPSSYPTMVDLLYDPKLGGDEPAYILRGLPAGAYGLDARENYLS
jgi:HD-GYP domain-containing protein (c-di-GMP phosphodiesterase class II)